MERNVKQIGLVNLLVLLIVGIAGFVAARLTHTLAGQAGSIFLGLGFLALLVSYFQMRLEETERLEQLEFDELNRVKGSGSLFNPGEAEAFPARRSREQFERFFVPGFTLALLVLQSLGAYQCWLWFKTPLQTAIRQPAIGMSLFALFALTLFLLGKYSAGVSRLRNDRLLRPGGSYLLLGAYICFIVAGAIAAQQLGFPKFDYYAAAVLGVLLVLAALENLFGLIFEMYRPRLKSGPRRVLYDSRLIGLLGHPEGIFTTAAQALDYQFGFKVSDTWLYRFFEKTFVWLVLSQAGLLLVSSCVVFISTGEDGLLERWGRPVAARPVLEPGLHFKLPYPIDRVRRYRTEQVQQFVVGNVQEQTPERTIVWTSAHEKDPFNLLVASRQQNTTGTTNASTGEQGAPVDILTVGIPVQYRITNILDWAYNYTDADALLQKIATREIVRYFVNVDLHDLMSSSRETASRDLRTRVQARANELKLGVTIDLVGLQDVHPPMGRDRVQVARKFEEVVGASQEVEAKLREAEGYAASLIPTARAQAEKIVRQAEADRLRRVAEAEARAARFTNQITAFRASPDIFQTRARLEALVENSTNSRIYLIMATNQTSVMQLNLEDKVASGLLTAPLPEARKN